MKAIWNNTVLAESKETIEVEGNHYFPPQSINEKYFEDSRLRTICPWKGEANYKTIKVDGENNQDAAWFYPAPKSKAAKIKNHYAFWKGVEIQD